MTKYVLLKQNGEYNLTYNGSGLKNKQKAVGGLIETLPVPKCEGLTAWLNEEGRLKNLKANRLASDIVKQEVVGDVLFECKNKKAYESIYQTLALEFAIGWMESQF